MFGKTIQKINLEKEEPGRLCVLSQNEGISLGAQEIPYNCRKSVNFPKCCETISDIR